MSLLGCIIIAIIVAWILAYHYASLTVWTIAFTLLLACFSKFSDVSLTTLSIFWIVFVTVAVIANTYPLRRKLITTHALKIFRQVLPQMSRTEKEALEAGTVSWEGDLFTGHPDWQKLLDTPGVSLTEEEQAFIDGPAEQLCQMIDEWDFTHYRLDMPPEVWQFIKDNGFMGMIIPKEYGGKGFSEWGHAKVLIKLYSRSVTVGTTVGVPNSLGPAELLLKYGTEDQKNYYLPRLAKGEEIPCFALTSPDAGSDAAAMPDTGIVEKGMFNGKEIIGIRLNWNKRYITFAPIATIVGLAFRLFDPDNLLGDKEDIGITCALIPRDTKGITIGRRHFPLNTAFLNGPTQGKDVFIPLDWIIGGAEMVGQGWLMLMECLGAGRAISLPSTGVGATQASAFGAGAYAQIRKQFNVPIGKFEGIEEPLARIGANAYITDSAMQMAVAAIDHGAKPSVVSAILKYHVTELARKSVCDAMDIHGGKGICLGPSNYLGRGYQNLPIGITVEGANILTRCLIIFGQGAMRCHPFLINELEAAKNNDLKKFDRAFFQHIGYIISNCFRAFFLSLTDARFSRAPKGRTKRYFQILNRYSAALAYLSEVSMLVLGGNLKRREKLSARLGDALSMLYLSSAVLKRYHDDGCPKEDLPIVRYACRTLLYKTQEAYFGVLKNFPNRFIAFIMKITLFPYGKHLSVTDDQLGHEVATLLLKPSPTRDRLTQHIHKKPGGISPYALLEEALEKVILAEPIEKKIHDAVKAGKLKSLKAMDNIIQAEKLEIIDKIEAKIALEAERLRQQVIAVDDFSDEELRGNREK